MKDNRLTNYDRYVLAERTSVDGLRYENAVKEEKKSVATNDFEGYSEYEKYLLGELQRKKREEPLMSENEYYGSRNGNYCAAVASDNERAGVKKFKFPRLKKSGKILLTIYVIFMVALASILIATNTARIPNNESVAGAISTSQDTSEPERIRAMSVEEEKGEEDGGWFDKLCDSLNK